MELKQLEVFSERINYGIVKMPGRSFPGCVIQGDSLSILYDAVHFCHRRAVEIGDSELIGKLKEVSEALKDRLLHYEQVLAALNIRLPYARQAD